MKLARFFATVGPFLEGRAGHAETVRALYGSGAGRGAGPGRRGEARIEARIEAGSELDAERLAIYQRFCRAHRFEAVESVFSETRAAVQSLLGDAGWESLVEDYFLVHRMHHVELNKNGEWLAPFVSSVASARGLPAWVPELADLEWWDWYTRSAPDEPEDAAEAAGSGKLRLASTVELRPYSHDLVGWLDANERPAAPQAGELLVLFWRDLELDPRRENASSVEILLLQRVLSGAPPLEAHPIAAPGELEETLDDLRQAGILRGVP